MKFAIGETASRRIDKRREKIYINVMCHCRFAQKGKIQFQIDVSKTHVIGFRVLVEREKLWAPTDEESVEHVAEWDCEAR